MAFIYETNEIDKDEVFRTHYYKTSYDNLKNAVIEYLGKNQFEMIAWNDDYSEGNFVKGNKFSLTIKVIMQNPRETSVDFLIESYSFLGSKKNAVNLLNDIYNFLGQKFEFKGLGLKQ